MDTFKDVRLDLMSSKQAQSYLRKKDLAILPVGCFEMHGPDIPLACDTFIDYAFALLLARHNKAVCLPPVFYTFPGASGPWPGTVEISNRATMDYVQAVTLALIKGGFTRVVLTGSHGPLGSMLDCVVRDIYQQTGHVVIHVKPYYRLVENLTKAKLPSGEDACVLGGMQVLGLSGVYNPASKVERPIEFPFQSIAELRKYNTTMPWTFARDYQHTGIHKDLKPSHALRIARVFDRTAKEFGKLGLRFSTYQREMKKLNKDRPWDKSTVWTRTR